MNVQKYIIEVRDLEGNLDFELEKQTRVAHPYLFSQSTFTIDDLCHYASYGQGREQSHPGRWNSPLS